MWIEYVPAKDAINRVKHGISLWKTTHIDWDHAVIWPDARFDDGEERMCGLVRIGERVYYVAFVDRGQARCVISFRKANKRECSDYVRYFTKW